MIRPDLPRRIALTLGVWIISGTILALCLLQGEMLWWPAGWPDGASRGIFRIAYLLVIPARILWSPFGLSGGHFMFAQHCVLYAFSTPPFYFGVWQLLSRVRRRQAARHVPIKNTTPENAMARRAFLKTSLGVGTWLGLSTIPAYGVVVAPSRLRVREETVSIADLPSEFEGLRIVHLSDTHYGPFISRDYLEAVFTQVNALEPDLILLTGDYVHHTNHADVPGIALLSVLRAKRARIAVLGNHDHWEGAQRCRKAFASIGISLIDNTRLFLTPSGVQPGLPSPETPALCIAGLGDLWEDELDFDAALRDVPAAMPRLMLSHNPDSAEDAPKGVRIDLMLCGHTHGGQVRLPLVGAPLAPIRNNPKYLAGLCQGPAGPVIVSNGVGMTVLPLRIGAPPEFGLITLHRAAQP